MPLRAARRNGAVSCGEGGAAAAPGQRMAQALRSRCASAPLLPFVLHSATTRGTPAQTPRTQRANLLPTRSPARASTLCWSNPAPGPLIKPCAWSNPAKLATFCAGQTPAALIKPCAGQTLQSRPHSVLIKPRRCQLNLALIKPCEAGRILRWSNPVAPIKPEAGQTVQRRSNPSPGQTQRLWSNLALVKPCKAGHILCSVCWSNPVAPIKPEAGQTVQRQSNPRWSNPEAMVKTLCWSNPVAPVKHGAGGIQRRRSNLAPKKYLCWIAAGQILLWSTA